MFTNFLKKTDTIFDRMLTHLSILAGFLLVFATFSVTAEVIARYFLNSPIVWVVEISEYILLYVTFLAAAWVLKNEGHVKMDLILSRLNPKTQHLTNTITSVVGVIVCSIIGWHGVRVTWRLFQTDYFTPTILELPKFIIIVIIAIGSFLLVIQFLRRAYGNLKAYSTSPD